MGLCNVSGCLGPGNAKKSTLTEGSYTVAVCLLNTEEALLVPCFLKSIGMLVATFEKYGRPSCTVLGCTNAYFIEPEDTPIVGSHRTCACSYGLTYWQCTAISNLAFAKHAEPPDGALVPQLGEKNYGVDPLHLDHSINCTARAVLHLPAPPPFPGHVSLIHAVQTIGARDDALQLRHADLFRQVYALPGMIQRTFVRVPLDIVRQTVLSLRWQPMMLSQLWCGTKLDHVKLLNTKWHVQQATQHDLPLCVDMKIHYELLKYLYGQSCTSWNFELHWSSLPLIYGVSHLCNHMITMLYRNFMPIICLVERVHAELQEGDAVPTGVKLLHMEKTILAELDAFAVAAQSGPPTDLQAKSKELLLGWKLLLKEYC